ncbi:MAG: transaldolase [Thiomonas sp.]|nr:transaldolase [Thiomonas sp.]
MSALDSLAASTVVVVDTADLDLLSRWNARDATTNPSLIRKAAADPRYAGLVASAVRGSADAHDRLDALLVAFGLEILQRLPGRVSTEVDARLSHDTEATLQRARALMARYAAAGVPRDRVLIKIAATWEGIVAARVLEAEGIHCNLTLLFSFTQAQACAAAGVKLISPFVGRITDWHRLQAGAAWDAETHRGANDPGVQAVVRIWRYYKQHGVPTEVMGASFRDIDQIAALSGCDLLTIPPALLDALAVSDQAMPRQLDVARPGPVIDASTPALDPAHFVQGMREDRMASEKLQEGVRLFSADTEAVLAQLAAA